MKNLKLNRKMIGAFLGIALICVAMGLFGRFSTVKLGNYLERVGQENLPAIKHLSILNKEIERFIVCQRTMLDPFITPEEMNKQNLILKEVFKAYGENLEPFEKIPMDKEMLPLWRSYQERFKAWESANNQFFLLLKELEGTGIRNPMAFMAVTDQARAEFMEQFQSLSMEIFHGKKGTANTGEGLLKEINKIKSRYHIDNHTVGESLANLEKRINAYRKTVNGIHSLLKEERASEAETLFEQQLLPVVNSIGKTFTAMNKEITKARNLEHKMTAQAMGPCLKTEHQAVEMIEKIIELYSRNASDFVMSGSDFFHKIDKFGFMIMLTSVGIAITCGLLLTRSIVLPLQQGVEMSQAMATGDFTRQLEIQRGDELGLLVKALNNTSSSLSQMFKDVTQAAHTMASSSTSLTEIAGVMTDSAEHTSSSADSVSAAGEELSSNMNSISAATEQAASNLNTVTSATEEMSSSISEIAKNAETARSISENAVSKAGSASSRVEELGAAAREIGKVTETITAISEQTNLLALNATIEAARAGEAGKGFAVVANEIKELAKQTADATQDISQKIEVTRQSTSATAKEINEITTVIDDINEIVAQIASAVEEQSVTTQEVTENLTQAFTGIGEVNENISNGALAAGEIARDITNVNSAASEISNTASQVNISAEELSGLAGKLNKLMETFKV
ncbi:MAG: methyl-accepting chemotaxis protein [Desulfobacteraceae bacterium]|nr:methyl-accepting chemotaxis protein [Desulfobacteraceae bacterium]